MATPMSEANQIRQIEARLSAKGRRVFTQAGWNTALRNAGMAAAAWWLANCAPKRWDTAYATGQLGYAATVGPAKRKRMSRGEPPYWRTGALNAAWVSRGRAEAEATKGRVRARVRGPAGWLNQHPRVLNTFATMPLAEQAGVAREFRRSLILALQAGRKAAEAKMRARAAAKAERRASRRAATAQRRAQRRADRINARKQRRTLNA